jgi:DNA repair protein RadB
VSSPSVEKSLKYDSSILLTGHSIIDDAIGGILTRSITHISGPPGVGKTTLSIQAYLGLAQEGFSSFIIDCGRSYNPSQLLLLSGNCDPSVHNITLFQPHTFQEQRRLISKLHLYLNSTVRLIVLDPFTHLYRLQMGPQSTTALYRELIEHQLPRLVELAKEHELGIIVINQLSIRNGVARQVGGEALDRYVSLEIQIQHPKTLPSDERFLLIHRRGEKVQRRLHCHVGKRGFQLIC